MTGFLVESLLKARQLLPQLLGLRVRLFLERLKFCRLLSGGFLACGQLGQRRFVKPAIQIERLPRLRCGDQPERPLVVPVQVTRRCGLVEVDDNWRITVREHGRSMLRQVCAAFDAYLAPATATGPRHAAA